MSEHEEIRLLAPLHVGSFIRSEIIEPAEFTVVKAAEILGVSRQALSDFLNANASLSPKMALRIEKLLASRWIH